VIPGKPHSIAPKRVSLPSKKYQRKPLSRQLILVSVVWQKKIIKNSPALQLNTRQDHAERPQWNQSSAQTPDLSFCSLFCSAQSLFLSLFCASPSPAPTRTKPFANTPTHLKSGYHTHSKKGDVENDISLNHPTLPARINRHTNTRTTTHDLPPPQFLIQSMRP